MDDLHSMKVTEELLPREDFSDKKEALRKYVDRVSELDKDFSALVNSVFIGEGEKGEIVDQMLAKTKQMEIWNTNLLIDVDHSIGQIVNRFEEQVDDMKTQELTITYEDLLVLG